MTQREDVITYEESRIRPLQEERLAIRKKTFTKWMNSFLLTVRMEVEDLFTDLADGRKLLKLLEIISGENLGKPENGKTRIHNVENLNKSLAFLKTKVRMQNIFAEDIVDGKPGLILYLIWTIILRFQIQEIQIEVDEERESSEKKHAKDALLLWCQRKTSGYPGVNILDFTGSWRDGLGFNAIIHAHRPDLIDFKALQPSCHIENLNNAFDVANNQLGIPLLLDAQDVDQASPDEKSVITYVASYYHTLDRMENEMKGVRQIAKFYTDANEAESLLNEKMALVASADCGEGERSAQAVLQCHRDLQGELNADSGDIASLNSRAEKLEQADISTLEQRPSLVQDSSCLFGFYRLCDDFENLIKDMERMLRADSLTDNVEAAKCMFETFLTDFSASSKCIEALDAAVEEFMQQGHSQLDKVQARQKDIHQLWDHLNWLKGQKERSLEGASSVELFNRTCDEARDRILEKMTKLDPAELGPDFKTVQALQRRHQQLELELASVEKKVERVNQLANCVKSSYPNERTNVSVRQKEVQDLWGKMTAKVLERRSRLEDAVGHQMFMNNSRNLLGWMESTKAALNADEIVTDIATAENLLKKHQEMDDDIHAHENEFREVAGLGGQLLKRNPTLTDIAERLELLKADHQAVINGWSEKGDWLRQCRDLQLLNREADEIEASTSSHEVFLDNTDLGGSLDAVKALIKQHEHFESTICAQDAGLKAFSELADRLIKGGHYDSKQIEERRNQVVSRRAAVKEAVAAREASLYASRIFHSFSADVNDLQGWMADQLKIMTDELYVDLTNLELKLQEHETFERELHANEGQLRAVNKTGQELLSEGGYRQVDIGQMLQELNLMWEELESLSHEKGRRLQQAAQHAYIHKVEEDCLKMEEMELNFEVLETDMGQWDQKISDQLELGKQMATEDHFEADRTLSASSSRQEKLPDTEEEQTELYVKDKGSAQTHGQLFEYKFCAILFLRAKNKGYNFKLASNVKGHGKFDYVFVEYLEDNSIKLHIFVQLKSKTRQRITMEQLLAETGDFSLCKYYESYIKIAEKFNFSEEGDEMEGSIDKSLFVIYTNADVASELKSEKVTDIGEEKFLMTGGTVLQFNKEEHKAIYNHLQGLPKHREFLRRFRVFYSQANEKEMDRLIKSELQQITKLRESELDIACMCFIDMMEEWWQHENFFLKDTNSREKDPLWKTSENVKPTLVAKMDQRNSEIDELRIKYEDHAITYMKQMTETHKAVLIFAPGISTTLTAAKIHQMLSDTEHIILKSQQLIRLKTEVMLAWKSMFDVLVLESDSSAEVSSDLFNELSGFLNGNIAEKKFIFISKSEGNKQQIRELRNTFRENLTEEYDSCKFTDIVTESRMLFLNKKVSFQGREVKLSTIVKNDDVRPLNALDCESISFLVENEMPSIGQGTEDTVKYYIDRTLQCRKQTNTRFLAQGEIQHTTGEEILQDVRDSSPLLKEKFAQEYWRPNTLLDGVGRIILVTNEAGMGKSTLLTHLAHQTRESHNDVWIVRVKINNYTRILNELQTNGCDEKGVIKLLTEVAQNKKRDCVLLERRLFNYTYNSTGNMAVLIDGVDEVCPRYTEEVIQVLKILSKTKIKRIWVTSRNSVRDRLETEFQCQSYTLVPFSEEDQELFLVKFWKETCQGIKDEHLGNLAKRVVKLSTEHLTVEDKNFMGMPLQSWLLAEMFEEDVKKYSTSTTVELPEHINIVVLYDLYVEKKWDIYLSDKKLSDRTHVMLHSDDVELHKSFIRNHMAAALVAILSKQQLEKLTDKTIAEVARLFLQKITAGLEKTGIIIQVTEGRPVFQHRTLAEYLAARWLCDNFQHGQTFMRDHLLESGFHVVRSMVDRILADKCPLHEALLYSSFKHVENLLRKKESMPEKDRGGRTPLHLAVSCRNPKLIEVLLEHRADLRYVDTLLGLSPVQYAIRMDDWEILSLLMEKRPVVREQVLNGTNHDRKHNIGCGLRAAAQYGHNNLLKYLISQGGSVNMAFPGKNSSLLHVAATSQQTETVKKLLLLGASIDCQDTSGKTPLHVSVETGNLEVIKCLVEHQETVQGQTELQHVVKTDRTVNRGNRLDLPDKDGNTPLHLGVLAGISNIVSYLVSVGSDLNICNVHGDNPLTLAARSGKNDIVELLLKSDVDSNEAKIGSMRAFIVTGHVNAIALVLRLGFPVNIGENEKPIHVASRLGRKEIVSLLLQFGASLKSRTYSGNTALHLASEAGHLNLVKYLVEEERDDRDTLNYEKETPLHLAARNGRQYIVIYFVKKGCNINAPSANGATCLHVACENGHYTTVECLTKHGAEVNVVNSANQTPLHVAARRGQREIAKLLLLYNANLSLRDKDGITALLAASINGHLDTVRFIMQHGGNIEDTDVNGNTIAHFAVANDNYNILNYLSQQNVSLNVKNTVGDTPLLQAVREGRNRMVQYLVERNCHINQKGNDGILPLDVAVQKGNMQIARILLERYPRSCKSGMHIVAAARLGFVDLLQRFVAIGDEINVKADNGESPLHAACESGHVATVQYLCEQGALLDWQDNNGNTALHVAVSNGHLDITRVLVENGANLCAADASGSTALHTAAKGGYLNIVQYLADSFAPIDKRNAKKETALIVATSEGNEKIVRVLIQQGAGIGVREREGKTAFDIATEKGYTDITQLLNDRAEGRKLVSFISHTEQNTFSEKDNVECLKRKMSAGASVVSATDTNDTDNARMLKTTGEDTLAFQSNPRSALYTAAVNGNLEEVQRLVEAGIALDFGDPFGRTALWVAAKSGHKLIIRYLLQNGSCVNIPDCEGVRPRDIAAREGHWGAVNEFLKHVKEIRPVDTETLTNQLYEASESGDLEVVQIILKHGNSVNPTNNFGDTPLHVAAKSGHKELTSFLLKCGANLNTANNGSETPLILAAAKGHVEIVRELLSATVVTGLSTPLLSAASEGHIEVVQELLNNGANVNTAEEGGYTPLYVASQNGHVECVREMLNNGANVNTADIDGRTPLYVAGRNGHVEVVREMLSNGANVNIAHKDGYTPLYVASQDGHVKCVRELLSHGANVNTAHKDGYSPLCVAGKNGHVECVRELLKNGANVNTADKYGYTSLYVASQNGHVECVRELLNNGANVNTVYRNGYNPLCVAGQNGHVECVQELLNNGANVNAADKDGYNPLCVAGYNGHVECVRELLNNGANVNTADKDGYTPLYIASHNGHVECVRELLNKDANVNTAYRNGYTPLYIAGINGHVEVVRELLNRGAQVDKSTKAGRKFISLAAEKGYLDMICDVLK